MKARRTDHRVSEECPRPLLYYKESIEEFNQIMRVLHLQFELNLVMLKNNVDN
jgi:hypothetical protein